MKLHQIVRKEPSMTEPKDAYVEEGADGSDKELPTKVANPEIDDPELAEIEEDKSKPVLEDDDTDEDEPAPKAKKKEPA